MQKNNTKNLTRAGLLVAVGLILPFVTAHAFGVPGTVLLPMHLPVLLLGFLCGPMYGALGGLIIPLLSCLLTNMPVAFPMLPIMAGELFTYGLISGLLYRRVKWPVYPSLLAAMVCGRLVYGAIFSVLTLANGQIKALPVWGAITTGLPGIVIQLILIPLIVRAVRRYERSASAPDAAGAVAAQDKARALVESGEKTCVLTRNGEIIYSESGPGVRPLLRVYEEDRTLLSGAVLTDKIVGKAAAMLAVLGGVASIHALTLSRAGQEYLAAHGVPVTFDRCVDVISNRTGNGICPLEKSVMALDDPQQGYETLKQTVAAMMAEKESSAG